MSDVKHTPEPWRLSGKSKRVVHYGYDSFTVNSEANARRIVAAVNACAGIETAHLELATVSGVTIADELARIKNQRDKLLEALETCLDYGAMTGDESVIDKARAAIEAVKGGAV